MAFRTPESLFEEFQKDWEAALCPSIEAFAARCHPERVGEFVDAVGAWMVEAPTPPYSPVQQRRLQEKIQERIGPQLQEIRAEAETQWREEYEAKSNREKIAASLRFRWMEAGLRIKARLQQPPWE